MRLKDGSVYNGQVEQNMKEGKEILYKLELINLNLNQRNGNMLLS